MTDYPYMYNQPQRQQTIQYGGIVRVRSEQDAKNYPVAPGNSVIFIDETAPYLYAKTVSFSQFDPIRFEKFRLVKEETPEEKQQKDNGYITRAEFVDELHKQFESLRNEIKELKESRESKKEAKPEKKEKEVTEYGELPI